MKYLIPLILIASQFLVKADNPKLKKAEKLYSNFSYKQAIELYEELAKQDAPSELITRRLANSYRLINDMKNAEKWYTELTAKYKYTAEDVFYLAMALRENGKDADADMWMGKFKELKQNDSRATEFVSEKELLKKWMKQENNYKIKNLSFNTDGIEFSPSFYGDNKLFFVAARDKELMIKHEFAWNQTPFLDIYTVSKNPDETYASPVALRGMVNTKFHDGPVCVTSDLKTIYFTRNNFNNKKKEMSSDGVLKLKLYTAQIDEKGEWKDIKEMMFDNKEYSVGHPSINRAGDKLYFCSDMPGSIGGTDIWVSEKGANGTWGAPKNMGPVINTEGNEMFPFIADNGDLFFASNGHFGLGGLDNFYAQNKNGEFKKIQNLGAGINSIKDDFGLIVSKEFQLGYFSSNREGGSGDDDIYSITFLKPLTTVNYIKGKIVDKNSGEPIANATAVFKDNNVEKVLTSNATGEFELEIEELVAPEISAKADKYFDGQTIKIADKFTDDVSTINVEIPLVKNIGYVLVGTVVDKKTNQSINGVKLNFSVNNTTEFTLTTNEEGKVQQVLQDKKPGDVISYMVKIEKEGYLSKEVAFSKKLENPGEISLNELLNNLNLEKLEVGADIGKLIDIKPIYFDLGKFTIRKDAALELDKIVKVLSEHTGMVIELGSHTDCRGSAKSNETLSDNRAKASAAYVVSKGIPAERIYGKGYGESKLVNGCSCEGAVKSKCPETEHQQNRRTEFVIVKMN